MRVEAKICGLTRHEDARLAFEAGADYLGVILAASPRRREAGEARVIWEGLGAQRVGVFVDPTDTEVIKLAEELGLDVAQLHGSEEPELCRRIREACGVSVWKAVRLRNESDLDHEVERYLGVAQGILLEGWSAKGKGGVGARLDWSLLHRAREGWPEAVRLILAGGLNPENVGAAIRTVRPDVVDVSSGVEARIGEKDPNAVRAFLEGVGRALSDDV